MKWILIVLGILLSLIGVVLLIGYLLPEKHKATVSRTFKNPPSEVWRYIFDFGNYVDWRSGLKDVKIETEDSWIETNDRNEQLTFKIIEAREPERMMTKIMDEKLPFGGTWTIEISTGEDGTTVTITENGEIYNAMFRFFAHFVFGYESTIKQYLDDLEKVMADK